MWILKVLGSGLVGREGVDNTRPQRPEPQARILKLTFPSPGGGGVGGGGGVETMSLKIFSHEELFNNHYSGYILL